jgi:hypothetical protein
MVYMANKSQKKWIVLVVIAALLLSVYYLWQNGWKLPAPPGNSSYQAIFLSNGQVYFGKASNLNGNYITLMDVYYLQVSQVLQPVQGKKEPQPTQSITLVKLGVSELHKPKDQMLINRDQVLFVEDLEQDSQVVQAIARYKEGQN